MDNNSLFEPIRNYTDKPVISAPVPTKFKAHFHQNVELLYAVEGESYVTVNGKSVTLYKDQIAISDSYDIHSYDGGKNNKSITLIIPAKYLKNYTNAKAGKVLTSNFLYDQEVAKKFKSIIDLIQVYCHDDSTSLIIEGLFSTILGMILKHIPLCESNSKMNAEFTVRVLNYIDENLTDDLSLSKISSYFHYNPCYFSNIFKSRFKKNYTEYVNVKRCNYAIYLMHEEDINPTQAALHSGFGSTATFYRFFKRYYGMSPLEYIEKL